MGAKGIWPCMRPLGSGMGPNAGRGRLTTGRGPAPSVAMFSPELQGVHQVSA